MSDLYDDQIEKLILLPFSELDRAWFRGGTRDKEVGLFAMCGTGCATMIKSRPGTWQGATPEITAAIMADDSIPMYIDDLKPLWATGTLEAKRAALQGFARVQRMAAQCSAS